METENKSYDSLLMQAQEKREFHRHRVLKSGSILFNNGYSSFACKVKNQHENGVMLQCESTVGIPSEFKFRMGGQGSSVPAKVVWRTETTMGVLLARQGS